MDVLRVLTLNVWNRSGPWEARLSLIRRGLEELAPDVVGLQEIVADGGATNQAHELADGLGYHVAYGPAASWAPGITMGNAVLSRFPVVEARTTPLPVEGIAAGPDIAEGRCLLSTRLDTPFGQLPFHTTHLAWRFHQGYAREAQVLAIVRAVEATSGGTPLPAVLVGDFNAEPHSAEIRFLTGLQTLGAEVGGVAIPPRSAHFADAFAWAGSGEGATFDRARNPYAAYTREPARRIDYVFVAGPDDVGRGEPVSARVVLDEVLDGVAPSDHFGVFAEITVSR